MVNRKVKSILAAFVVGGILLGAGTSYKAYANTAGISNLEKSAQDSKMPGHKIISTDEMAENLKIKLDPLVKAGTITQDQEDKIISFMKTRHNMKISEMEKVKNMTEVEKKAYFENKTKTKNSMMKELVSAKIINQTQADAIKKVIGHKSLKGKKNFNIKFDGMKNNLDTAVKDGTITQAQEDKILAYIKQKNQNRKAEMQKVKSMTEAERKAYFENKSKTVRTDIFKELVGSGTITQAQADKLKKMMPACPKGKGFGRPGTPDKEKQ